jgi:hypothetical protein
MDALDDSVYLPPALVLTLTSLPGRVQPTMLCPCDIHADQESEEQRLFTAKEGGVQATHLEDPYGKVLVEFLSLDSNRCIRTRYDSSTSTTASR